jgi:hypothetical protein
MVFLPFLLLPASVLANLCPQAVRLIQLAVDERYHGQDVEGVLFGHIPLGFWRVGERVADRAVQPFQQVHEAVLLALVRFSLVWVDRQEWVAELLAKGVMDEIAAIAGQAGERPEFGRDTFHGLEDGVEVVFFEQFRFAELQHVGVDAALDQGAVKSVSPFQRLGDGPGSVGLAEFPILAECVAAEGQYRVQTISPGTKDVWLTDKAGGVHCPVDEDDDVVAHLMFVLKLYESVVQPLPLRHLWRRVRDVAVSQQMVDLRAGQPLVRVGEDFADRLQPFGGKW